MNPPIITDYGLEFTKLYARDNTDLIIVHHTGNPTDDDLSAEQIHYSHLSQGWSGIGYHYVIRKDGSVEMGRPEWAYGAHAEGENWNSIGIHVCGNFEVAEPTQYQIESLAYLIAWIADKYDIPINDRHVLGHCDVNATACPGKNLYELMDTIRGKAIWYQQNYKDGD